MMSKAIAIPYSEELFRFITKGINNVFNNCKGDVKLNLRGIWPFLYFEGSNSLKSIGPFFISKAINLAKSDKQKLNQSIINCDYGSIGYAFKKIKENIASKNNESYHYLYKTFNDPRGVVCYLDSKIRQEHAIFFPVIDNDHNILGILDLFFYGDINEEELHALTDILWKNFRKKRTLYRLCVNTFIIQQFSEFQITSNKNSNIDKPITRIEKLLSLISDTPLFYFTYRNYPISANYIGINFESIQNLINHEFRFCSYVKREIKCFHKMQLINNGLSCQNNILSKFYYDILKEAKLKSCRKEYHVLDCEYIVESVQFESVELPIINNDYFRHKELTGYEGLNEVAQNKFKSEILFSFIKKKLKDAIVLTLYQKIKRPYLIYVGDGCNKETDFDQPKEYISPSELMHYQYSTDEQYISSINNEQLLRRSNSDDKESEWNVVHFEIINKELFVNILKKNIADKPEEYAKVLLPYWNIKKNLFQKRDLTNEYEDLQLHYLGNDPLKLGDKHYSSIINEQISLILSEFKGKEAEKQATRAAISQVMARNMSHNIGSHVLSKLVSERLVRQIYFKNKETVNKYNSNKFSDYCYYQCLNKLPKIDWKDNESTIYCSKEIQSPNDTLVAILFDYLRKRMDYLADITTITPVIENSKFFFNDIISPFIQNRALNDRISGISEFMYEIILCKPIHHESHCVDQKTTNNCKVHSSNFIINDYNDFQVSIPNDVVGIHAFYTILENIIRNTAKHAQKSTNGIVEFKIKVQDANELYGCYISELIDTNLNEFYAVSIFDNCVIEQSKLNNLVDNQNMFLNESVLDTKSNQLRQSHWGLIEMDASASYLRKLSVDQIDSDCYNISDRKGVSPVSAGRKLCILQAYPEQNKYLGYRFFIRKPHEVLVVTSVNEKTTMKNNEDIGIWIKNIQEIKEAVTRKISFPHRLVIISPKAKEISKLIKFNPFFTTRMIDLYDYEDINEFLDINTCWKKYYLDKNTYSADEETTDPNCRYALEDHGTNYCMKLYGNNGNCKNKFIEIVFSSTRHFFSLKQPYGSNMLFSWPLKVAIIDERIQALSKETYPIQKPAEGCEFENNIHNKCFHSNGGVPYSDLYKNTNVIVPDEKEANLNSQSLDNEYDKIISFIVRCIEKISKNDECMGNGLDENPCEFVVIHLGIIEKLIASFHRLNIYSKKNTYNKEIPSEIGNFIKTEIFKFSNIQSMTDAEREKYDRLVLTSGRGKPHNLPEDVRYLNYSALSQYLTTQRNKFALTEALFAARNQKSN